MGLPRKESAKLVSSRMSPKHKTKEKDISGTSKAISTNFTDGINIGSNPTPGDISEPSNSRDDFGGPPYDGEQTARCEQASERDANDTEKGIEDGTLKMVTEVAQSQLIDAHDALRKDENEETEAINIRKRLTSLFSENADRKSQRIILSQVTSANGSLVKRLNRGQVEAKNEIKASLDNECREYEESETVATIKTNLSQSAIILTEAQISSMKPPRGIENDERNTKLKIPVTPPNSLEQTSSTTSLMSCGNSFHFIEQQRLMNKEQIDINGPQGLNKENELRSSTVATELLSSSKPSHSSQIGTPRVTQLPRPERPQSKKGPGNNPSLLAVTYELLSNVDQTTTRAFMAIREKVKKHVPFDVIETQVDINLGKNNTVPINRSEMIKNPIASDGRINSSESDDISLTNQLKPFRPTGIEKLTPIMTEQESKSEVTEFNREMPTNPIILLELDPNNSEKSAGSKEHKLMMENITEFEKPCAEVEKKAIIREKAVLTISAEVVEVNEPIEVSLLHGHHPTSPVEAVIEEKLNESFSELKEVYFLPNSSITSSSAMSSPCSSNLSSEPESDKQNLKFRKCLTLPLPTEIKPQSLEEELQEDSSDFSSLKDETIIREKAVLTISAEVVEVNEPIEVSLFHGYHPTSPVEAVVEEKLNESFSGLKEVYFLPNRSITHRSAMSSPCSRNLSSESEGDPRNLKLRKCLTLTTITEIKPQSLEEELQEDSSDFNSLKDEGIIREKAVLTISAEFVDVNEPIQVSLLHGYHPTSPIEAVVEEKLNESFSVLKEVYFLRNRSITHRSAMSSSCSSNLSSEPESDKQNLKFRKCLTLSLLTVIKPQSLEEELQEDSSDFSSLKDESKVGENTLLTIQSGVPGEAIFNDAFEKATIGRTERSQEESKNLFTGKEKETEVDEKKSTQVLRIPPNSSERLTVRLHQCTLASHLCRSIRQTTTFPVEVVRRSQECEKLTCLALPDMMITIKTVYSCPVAEVAQRITHSSERISMNLIEAAEVMSDSKVVFVQAIQLNNPECAKSEIHKGGSTQESLKTTEIDSEFSWSSLSTVTGVTPLEQMLETAVLRDD
ncbi:hypothetical protein Aperf_G00000046477 [Anoplocephala perfoliata]